MVSNRTRNKGKKSNDDHNFAITLASSSNDDHNSAITLASSSNEDKKAKSYIEISKLYSEFRTKLAWFILIFGIGYVLIGYTILSYAFLNFISTTLLISLVGYSIGILISQQIFKKVEISKDLFINNGDSQWMTKTQALRNKIHKNIREKTKFISRYDGWKFKIWNLFLSFICTEVILICIALNSKVIFLYLYEFFPDNWIIRKFNKIFRFVFEIVDEFIFTIVNFIGINLKEKEILMIFAPIIMIFFISLNSIYPLLSNFLRSEQDMSHFLTIYKTADKNEKKELIEQIDSNNKNTFEILALNDLFINEIS